jgi:hypothetical protein
MCVDYNNKSTANATKSHRSHGQAKRFVSQDNNDDDGKKTKKQRVTVAAVTASATASLLSASATAAATGTTTACRTQENNKSRGEVQQAQQQQEIVAVPGVRFGDTYVIVGVTNRGLHCKICRKKGGYEQCHHDHNRYDMVDATTGTTISMTELCDEIVILEQELATSSGENRSNPFASINSTMMNIRIKRHGLALGYVTNDNFSNTDSSSIRSSSSASTSSSTAVTNADPEDALCHLMEQFGLE